ncbi:cyclic nucleotide-binding domain-containing protein [Spirillospora sp. NPDC049024]
MRRSTIAELLNGNRMPKKAVLDAFLRACEVEPADIAEWMNTWERLQLQRVQPGDHASSAGPVPESVAPPTSFWHSLTTRERRMLRDSATEVTFLTGQALFRENDVADHLLIIQAGRVRVSAERDGQERIIAFRGPGDVIGERDALMLRRRAATALAFSEVHCLRLGTQRFVEFLSDQPRVVAVLERQMYDRIAESGRTGASPASSTWSRFAPSPPEPPRPIPQRFTGQMCSILFTDVVGFSAAPRSDADLVAIRGAMYDLLRGAFDDSDVPWEGCPHEDRGDGMLVVIPPHVPPHTVIEAIIPRFTAGLRRHNRRSSRTGFQVRAALNVGPVRSDRLGVTGSAIIHAARLLDAPPFREAMARTGAALGFITSEFVYESVIRSAGLVDAASYERVRFTSKETKTTGWLKLLDPSG